VLRTLKKLFYVFTVFTVAVRNSAAYQVGLRSNETGENVKVLCGVF